MIYCKRVEYISISVQEQSNRHLSPYVEFEKGLQFCPAFDMNPFKQAVQFYVKL